MSRRERIEAQVRQALRPEHVELRDDSGNHSVPKGSESHWALLVVSAAFEGQTRVARHRSVYQAVAEELGAGMHALKMETLTPTEWQARGGAGPSTAPLCLGGSKQDSRGSGENR